LVVRNGTSLIPNEPIVGNTGTSIGFQHVAFLEETYKAWGKLHDPDTDGAINAANYTIDEAYYQ